jgi:Fe-S-cluster-containing dehydrogenase component/anaerobic selenocysteine-containing dehydrogenase
MNRRDFLRVLGVTGAGALLAGCEKGPTKMYSRILPTDDNVLPGEFQLIPTTCTECPAACGIIAKIRNGHPVKLEGNPAHPFNRGALCMRGQASISRLYLPNRLQTPLMKNTEGKFVETTWENAFARINAELTNDKKHLFLSNRTTGVLSELVDEFCKKRNVTRLQEYEFYSHSAIRVANEIGCGVNNIPVYNIAKADLLITFGADIVETFLNPVQFTHDLVANEKLRWIHLEPHFSLTGNFADERLTVRPGSEAHLLVFLANELNVPVEQVASPTASMLWEPLNITAEQAATETGLKAEQIQSIAEALKKAKTPLLIVGGVATGTENGLMAAALAAQIQARYGRFPSFSSDFSRVGSLNNLAWAEETLLAGKTGVFFVHNADPAAYRPKFLKAMDNAALRVGLGETHTATLDICDIILPLSQTLESWSEVQTGPIRGVIQPTIKPLHNTRSSGEILLTLAGESKTYEVFLTDRWGNDKQELITAGFCSVRKLTMSVHLPGMPKTGLKPVLKGNVLVVVPSLRTFDGRSNVLPLLTEIPDTLSAISFGDFVAISKVDAEKLGAKDNDVISITASGLKVKLPVRIQPAMPAGVFVVQLPFLQGQTMPVVPETGEAATVLTVEAITLTQQKENLAILSGSMDQDHRGIAPEHDHDHEHEEHEGRAHPTLYEKHEHKPYRWALSVDLERCTGCGACVAACYVENNIALVGWDEHVAGREMSWIRLEPYTRPDGKLDLIPMMCQQCDDAPCESVCPVYATYHNPEGLNAQVYNRCVGTRYCSNNCPYKVRRFNWLDHPLENPLQLMVNPDVSLRPKGVMEKCTFCVQRITHAKDKAQDEKRLVRDGEITTACAQTCPGQAITFGNILDKNSRVYAKSQDERAYRALEELGTLPAVYYLKSGEKHNEA